MELMVNVTPDASGVEAEVIGTQTKINNVAVVG
jgi:hypothetical protein